MNCEKFIMNYFPEMEPFKIHILGCGSALPTLKHNASSQLIEMRGKCYFMVDCGEGAQMQFRRSHIHFSKLNAIFISHMPMATIFFGLMGVVVYAWNARTYF